MEGRELETIAGTVQAVVFQNQENGYTVLRLRTEEDTVTAVGCMPGATPGESLVLYGQWTAHQSYGQQFKAERFQRQEPREERAVYEYLASGIIKGLGAKTARLIVSKFGARSLEILEDSPEELTAMLEQLSQEERFGLVLRAKGIVAGPEGQWLHFDYVPGEPEVRTGSPSVTGRLCVIGSKLDSHNLEQLFGLEGR